MKTQIAPLMGISRRCEEFGKAALRASSWRRGWLGLLQPDISIHTRHSDLHYEVYEALRRAIEEDRRARRIKPQALEIAKRYHRELPRADPSPMVIHRRISKLNYEKRYVQASAIVAYRRKGVKVSPGMTVGYVVRDADQWEVDTEWDASDFDIQYYGKLLGKAWDEAAFVFKSVEGRCS